VTAADARSGSTVGKYRLHEIVGRGGMGVVYRAEHVYIGREVAVKILHEGFGGREEAIKRFLREARAASSINHPNIVDVTDFGKATDGTVFFVMELLVGEPLDTILVRDRRLDLLRSINICNQLAAALAAAHRKGIVHRDLKPENVMLIEREGRRELVRRVSDESGPHEIPEREKRFDFVKILDFGVAKVREPDAEKGATTTPHTGVVFGTPEYMAPETARIGYSDARSDIYALGIMFYEMLTGTVPFRGNEAIDVMLKQVNAPVPPMSEVAPDAEITSEAERMILKALSKDPDLRQQTMEEFHRELQGCYGQLRFRRTMRTPTAGGPLVAQAPNEPGSTSRAVGDPPPAGSDTTAAASAVSAVSIASAPSIDGSAAGAWVGAAAGVPAGVPAAIPLTKLKRALPGAMPTHIAGAGPAASAQELVLEPGPGGATTAAVPELATAQRRPAQPILLTRRKPARAMAAASFSESETPGISALLPGATPTDLSRADSSPGAIPVATPGESRKRTTLPLRPAALTADSPPTTEPSQSASWTAAPAGRPPGTPPLPLWGTDVRGLTSPARAHPPTEPSSPGSVPRSIAADRPTPRVDLDGLHRAVPGPGPGTGAAPAPPQASAEGTAARPSAPPPPDGGALPDEERPPWFDGPTVVRNPLSLASLRDLKPPGDS
jgi:serine/threonine-protein kinase